MEKINFVYDLNKSMNCESEVMCQTDMTEEYYYGKEKECVGCRHVPGGGGGVWC